MKTDRRHELQTNVLADWIGKHLLQVQGHSKTILAILLLLVAAAIAGTFLAHDQAARSQASWNQFFQAFGQRDPEALEIVASNNQGTTAAVWARLAEADLKLEEGIGDLYTNRSNAKKNLEEAKGNYEIVDQIATDKLLRERAWFGLGQVYESMAEIGQAKEFYDKLDPNSALGKEARRRSEVLSSASTEKWYNWFANQTPRPSAIPGMPSDLDLPNLPRDLGNLSDRPDLSLPELPSAAPDSKAAPPADDSSEAGPELNGPAAVPNAAPSDGADAKTEEAAAPKPAEAETPQASDASAEPTPSESEPESSETPAKEG